MPNFGIHSGHAAGHGRAIGSQLQQIDQEENGQNKPRGGLALRPADANVFRKEMNAEQRSETTQNASLEADRADSLFNASKTGEQSFQEEIALDMIGGLPQENEDGDN